MAHREPPGRNRGPDGNCDLNEFYLYYDILAHVPAKADPGHDPGWMDTSSPLEVENAALRHQLVVLRCKLRGVADLLVGRRSACRPGLDFASAGQAADSDSGRTYRTYRPFDCADQATS